MSNHLGFPHARALGMAQKAPLAFHCHEMPQHFSKIPSEQDNPSILHSWLTAVTCFPDSELFGEGRISFCLFAPAPEGGILAHGWETGVFHEYKCNYLMRRTSGEAELVAGGADSGQQDTSFIHSKLFCAGSSSGAGMDHHKFFHLFPALTLQLQLS